STGLHLVVDARVPAEAAPHGVHAVVEHAPQAPIEVLAVVLLGQVAPDQRRSLGHVDQGVVVEVVVLDHPLEAGRDLPSRLVGRRQGLWREVPVDRALGLVGLVVARHHFLPRPHHTITRSRQPSASSVTDITPGADSAPEMLRNHELPLSDVGAMNIHRSSPQVCTRRLWKCPKMARSACPIGVRPAACPANHLPSWSGLRTWCPCATPSTLPPTAWMATDSLCCSGA